MIERLSPAFAATCVLGSSAVPPTLRVMASIGNSSTAMTPKRRTWAVVMRWQALWLRTACQHLMRIKSRRRIRWVMTGCSRI